MTRTGWSRGRLAHRVLGTPVRFTVSGQQITITTGETSADWHIARPQAREPARPLQIARPPPKYGHDRYIMWVF